MLLLFIIAGLIALLLNPPVTLLRRVGFPRGAAVGTVFLVLVLALTGLGILLADPIANQVSSFRDNVPGIVDDANASLADLQSWLDRNGIDLQVSEPGRTAVESLGDRVAEGSGELAAFTRDALLRLVEASIAVILIIVLAVYMLIYGERIGAVVRRIVPPGDGSPEDDFPTRIQGAVFGYVRGQLLFSLIMGTSAGVCLWVLGSLGIFPDGKTYAFAFGAFFGFAELIPYIGPAVGAFPPVMIALFSPEPLDALWLVDRVHRAAADRGPHRRPERVRARAAHQPAAGDLRAAARRAALRLHRRLHRAPDRRRAARDGRLPAPPPRARAVAARPGGRARRGRDRGRGLPRVRGRAGARRGALRRLRDRAGRRRRGRRRGVGRAVVTDVTAAPVALTADGVSKAYGERRALQGVSFSAHRGERIAIIGPNGAGKTTLLQILAGSLKPTGGSVSLEGGRDRLGPAAAGALLEAHRGREPAPVRAARAACADVDGTVERMLDQTGLRDRARDELGSLSGGNRQRVNVAIGLLAEPSVLLLDEPTSSLDPRQRERLWAFVSGLAEAGTAVVYATHNVAEAERFADRVLVLADGELLFSGSPRELERTVGGDAEAPDFESAFVRFLHERGH